MLLRVLSLVVCALLGPAAVAAEGSEVQEAIAVMVAALPACWLICRNWLAPTAAAGSWGVSPLLRVELHAALLALAAALTAAATRDPAAITAPAGLNCCAAAGATGRGTTGLISLADGSTLLLLLAVPADLAVLDPLLPPLPPAPAPLLLLLQLLRADGVSLSHCLPSL